MLGTGHPNTLTSMAILVLTETAQGRRWDAKRFHVQLMDTLKTKLGAGHPDRLTSMTILALT